MSCTETIGPGILSASRHQPLLGKRSSPFQANAGNWSKVKGFSNRVLPRHPPKMLHRRLNRSAWSHPTRQAKSPGWFRLHLFLTHDSGRIFVVKLLQSQIIISEETFTSLLDICFVRFEVITQTGIYSNFSDECKVTQWFPSTIFLWGGDATALRWLLRCPSACCFKAFGHLG